MSNKPKIRVRVAVLIPDGEKILLVQHQKGDYVYWLLPGGGVEVGESLKDALEREIMEECCLAVEPIRPIFISDAISPDLSRHILNIVFLSKIVGGKLRTVSDNRVKKAEFVSVKELDNIVVYPNYKKAIKDAYRKNYKTPTWYLGQIWET